ncbi:hypothetical protein BJ508DRAFT_337108, partial [Ascobolus immersus RN42]
MVMVRGLAGARTRVEAKARVRREEIRQQLEAIPVDNVNARLAVTQPGPYTYSIQRPDIFRDGEYHWDPRNPEEFRPGGPLDTAYGEYNAMKRQFGQMQIAQGVVGNITFFMPQAIRDRLQEQLLGISFPMPAAIRERINVARAVMEPRFREFCRIRTHIATLPARRLEHLALWQKWHPGRDIDEYVMPAFLNEPDQPRVVPTADAFVIQNYTVKVSDIADNPPPHLRALQTVQPRPAKRKADVLSPIHSHVPFKSVFSNSIDPKAKSIEVAHIDHSRVSAAMRYSTMSSQMPERPVQSTLGPDYLYDSPPASLASSSTHSSPSMETVSIPFCRRHLQQDFAPPPNDVSAWNNNVNLEV